MDKNLKTYITKYDRWLKEKLISHSSKVIPVNESLDGIKHMIPSVQAIDILEKAHLITLAECICRQRYKRCDKPLEVCFILDETGEKWIEKGLSKKIDLAFAKTILKQANEHGLVHLTLFKPDHKVFALCSCCSCCCHDLQLVLAYGKDYLLLKSDYIAHDEPALCQDCGQCIQRCQFFARQLKDNQVSYDPEKCVGCGLCITSCPENAITLGLRT
ncbi:MAG: 4Fe-4S binding protein [Pseudomonadota bacterium]